MALAAATRMWMTVTHGPMTESMMDASSDLAESVAVFVQEKLGCEAARNGSRWEDSTNEVNSMAARVE